MHMQIIDISQELFAGRIYPGDASPVREQVKTIEHDKYNLTNISMCVHNGTHADAPKHFAAGGKAVHELDLSIFYGKCTVVELEGLIGRDEIACILKNCAERLLFKGNCELSGNAAILLAASHVRLVGVESQSIGNFEHPQAVHTILLEKGIIPLEGLDLTKAEPGEYILSAFPLNLEDSDGSPVRAVLIREGDV